MFVATASLVKRSAYVTTNQEVVSSVAGTFVILRVD